MKKILYLILALTISSAFILKVDAEGKCGEIEIASRNAYGEGLTVRVAGVSSSEEAALHERLTEAECNAKGRQIERNSQAFTKCVSNDDRYTCNASPMFESSFCTGMDFQANGLVSNGPGNTYNGTCRNIPGFHAMCNEIFRPNNEEVHEILTGDPSRFNCSCTSISGNTREIYVEHGASCPSGYREESNEAYYYCSLEDGKLASPHESFPKNQYTYTSGNSTGDAYCVDPGKDFWTHNYCEDTSWDVSTCERSNESLECGLAAILHSSKKNNLSYGATTTALRLWATYMGAPDGIGEGADVKSNRPVYGTTAREILNSGWNGDGDPSLNNVLYVVDNSTSLSEFQSAADLFAQASQGSLEVPSKLGDLSASLNRESVSKTSTEVVLITTFPKDATVEAKVNGNPISVSKPPFECNKYGNEQKGGEFSCYKIDFAPLLSGMDCTDKNQKQIFNLEITAKADGLEGATIARYVTGDSKYQTFLVYEELKCEAGDEDCNFSKTFKVTASCEDDKCCETNPGMQVKDNIPETCGDGVTEGQRNDPEMDCILNACDKGLKEQYNESTRFGVNQQVCEIYCREDIEFSLLDKKTVMAGMQFRYELEGRVVTDQYLTSVVVSRRQCATEIKYDEWKTEYDKRNKAVLDTWNAYKFWDTLNEHIGEYESVTKTAGPCGGDSCCDNSCSEIGDDGEEHSVCCDSGCENNCGPKDYDVWYWGTNGSGPFPFNTTNVNGGTNSQNATHSSGSGSCSANCCDGSCSLPIVLPTDAVIKSNHKSTLGAYVTALKQREQWIIDLQNCNLYSNGGSCGGPSFVYEQNDGDENSTDGAGHLGRITVAKDTICENASKMDMTIDLTYGTDNECVGYEYSGTQTLEGKSEMFLDADNASKWCDEEDCYAAERELGGNTTKEHEYWYCRDKETSAVCEKRKIQLPVNYNASFKTVTEANHYTSRTYYTELFTGVVRQNKVNDNYVPLGKNLYPVCVEAFTAKYKVDLEYKGIGEYNKSDHDYYCTYDVFNDTTKYQCDKGDNRCENTCCKEGECYDEVIPVCISGETFCENPPCNTGNTGRPDITNGFIFRNIDPAKVFPDATGPRTNWATTEGAEAIKEIESGASTIWQKEPKYSFTVGPEDLRHIREYNQSKNNEGGYLDRSVNCVGGDPTRCYSIFFDDIKAYRSEMLEMAGDN